MWSICYTGTRTVGNFNFPSSALPYLGYTDKKSLECDYTFWIQPSFVQIYSEIVSEVELILHSRSITTSFMVIWTRICLHLSARQISLLTTERGCNSVEPLAWQQTLVTGCHAEPRGTGNLFFPLTQQQKNQGTSLELSKRLYHRVNLVVLQSWPF